MLEAEGDAVSAEMHEAMGAVDSLTFAPAVWYGLPLETVSCTVFTDPDTKSSLMPRPTRLPVCFFFVFVFVGGWLVALCACVCVCLWERHRWRVARQLDGACQL